RFQDLRDRAPGDGKQDGLGPGRVAHRADGRLHPAGLGPLSRVDWVADAERHLVLCRGPAPAQHASNVAHPDDGNAHESSPERNPGRTNSACAIRQEKSKIKMKTKIRKRIKSKMKSKSRTRDSRVVCSPSSFS